jgi:hypothetical protein
LGLQHQGDESLRERLGAVLEDFVPYQSRHQ